MFVSVVCDVEVIGECMGSNERKGKGCGQGKLVCLRAEAEDQRLRLLRAHPYYVAPVSASEANPPFCFNRHDNQGGC